MSETDLQTAILRSLGHQERSDTDYSLINLYVRNRGMFWRANSSQVMRRGRPLRCNTPGCADILGVYAGVPVAIEVKVPTAKQLPSQELWQRRWYEAGGVYFIARSVEDTLGLLNSIKRVEEASPDELRKTLAYILAEK